jgi:hypothetical protein
MSERDLVNQRRSDLSGRDRTEETGKTYTEDTGGSSARYIEKIVAATAGRMPPAGYSNMLARLAASSPAAALSLCRELQQTHGNFYTQKVILEGLGAEEERHEEPGVFLRERDSRESLSVCRQVTGERGMGNRVPRVFIDSGKTGSAGVHWGGGGGGKGNQGVGSVTEVAPVIEASGPPAAGGSAKAWVRAGTGTATVTRSYVGVLTGANGPNYYITAAGSTRIDRHEQMHINSSRSIHNTNITPLEQRVTNRTGEANALSQGSTAAEARTALETLINWSATISAFTTQDTTANTPYGTVDATELAAADYIHDYGPQSVGSVNYAHYIDIPPGPSPPAPATGGGTP